LWRDLFEVDLPENPINVNAEELKKPGLFKITDWALQRRLSPEFAGHIERLKAGIEAFKKAMPPEYPIAAGLEDVKDPSDLKVFERGNPYVFGEDAPRAYQLSSASLEANIAKDPDNRYYWRANRRRLEAEGIWDGVLSAAGKLDVSKVGGPSDELDAKMVRRGLYGAVSRVFPNEFQTL